MFIQISNTYLAEFLNILLYVEANPVWMCRQCLYSAVIFNSKLDYCIVTRSVNSSLVFFYPLDSVSLLTGASSSSLGNSFWTSLTVFGVFCYFQTRVTCRPKSRCQSYLSTVSVLANRNLHQDLMHSGCRGTAVPKACPQAFSLFPLPNSPLDQRPVHRLL